MQVASLKGHTAGVTSVAFLPNGRWVVLGSTDAGVCLWDVRMNAQVGSPLKGHAGWVKSVAFSPTGKQIVSGMENVSLCLWNR